MTSSISSADRVDDLRAKFPLFGFALYAIEPGKAVTFEVYTPDGQTFTFKAKTSAAAIEKAFPSAAAAVDEVVEEGPAPQVDLFS